MSAPVHPRSRRRRGAFRRLLETRGLVGGFRRPHALVRVVTADGTRLVGSYLVGPTSAPTSVLMLHGLFAHRRKPSYAALADALSTRMPVLALDLRGHGASTGVSTLGDQEVEDVAAGVRWLRQMGHAHVVVMGMSMGGTAALHAVAKGIEVDALVTVSTPAWWRSGGDGVAMGQLRRIWQHPVARAGVRLVLGVRVAGPAAWGPPPHPAEMAQRVRVPWLAVHGDDDHYFPPADVDVLVAATPATAVAWHEPPGFGHAEDGLTPAFVERLREALLAVATHGRFPT